MTGKSDGHFQELTAKERASKLLQLARSGSSLLLWEKGSKTRQTCGVSDFFPEHNKLILSGSKSAMAGKTVLFSFELNGLSFFGSGLASSGNGALAIATNEKLFKRERRNTFRLLTFPHHKVFLRIKLGFSEPEAGNVVGIKSGMSETGLFKSFLKLVKGKDGEILEESDEDRFRVLDISVTGAALQVGELESKNFPRGFRTGKITLEFNGEEVGIPDGEVVYNIDMLAGNTGQRASKVGVRFLGVDTNLDHKLGSMINGALRDFESEFEDFIK